MYALISHVFKIHFNIILPSMPVLEVVSVLTISPPKKSVLIFLHLRT